MTGETQELDESNTKNHSYNNGSLSSPVQLASGDSSDYYNDCRKNASFLNDENHTNLIVNYLPPNMSQEEVRSLFQSLGEVESCKLVRDKTTGESLGYAFVKFTTANDAEKAIRTLNGLRLQNKTIKVSLARPSSDAIKGANLYICGLPKKMSQAELERLFSQCGKIITARILYDSKSGLSRGVAFIRFDQRSEAECAIKKLNGFQSELNVEPITVKFANSPSATRQETLSLSFLKQLQGPTPTPSTPPSRSSLMSPFQQLNRLKFPPGMDLLPQVSLPTPSPALLPQALIASSGAFTSAGWSIFVYNLAPETEDATLWQLFGPFGAVQSVKVIKDPVNNKCKGFGFITMSNYEEAALAIQSLNGFILGNRTLQVSFKTSPNGTQKLGKTGNSSPENSVSPTPQMQSQQCMTPQKQGTPIEGKSKGIHG